MEEIFPNRLASVDPSEALVAEMMSRRDPSRGRPWVFANMIMSVDGAFAREGRSGGLGGSADKAMFHALRGLADTILVGAGTARTERYRRPSSDEPTTLARQERSQTPAPQLALVSGSGHVPDDQPFRTGTGPDPIVFVPRSRLERMDGDSELDRTGIEYLGAGTEAVDLDEVLDQLAERGTKLVLCEGGPQLLGDLVAAGLLDQIFVTLAPKMVAGTHTGLLGSHPELDAELTLEHVMTADGYLMLNYTIDH